MASASAETTTPLLEATGVSKTFGPVHALRDVDFEVNAGEAVALVGDNGAGKSTLVKLAVTIADVRSEVGTLSGGQRQQVAIARSLLGNPTVVLLDEPTAALGVRQTREVLKLIKRLGAQGHGVVVISHNLENVFAVADRIVVLRLGEVAGSFDARATNKQEIVAAITGAGGLEPAFVEPEPAAN